MERVAYLGPEATFTHLAVQRQFGEAARAIPCATIGDVFAAVERGDADAGVVPIENSSEGVVNHTLDRCMESPLRICAEIILEISHCLLMREGASLAEVARVYSHPQALAQCRRWLAESLPGAAAIEASSTAEAARRARDDQAGAAIASELAAELYELQVARRGIEDLADNVTRFLVIGREVAEPTGRDRTSLLLAIADGPGSLYRALEPFAAGGINLTRIESRPSRKKPWDYVFFIDVEGHERDEALARCLAAVARAAQTLRVLGSYRRAD